MSSKKNAEPGPAPNRHPSLHANLGFRLTKWDRFVGVRRPGEMLAPRIVARGSLTSTNGMKFRLVRAPKTSGPTAR